jgi:hypothetical protein
MGKLPLNPNEKRSGSMNAVLSKIAQGVTVCYSEIFPNQDNDFFPLDCMGKLFLVADSYCMNPYMPRGSSSFSTSLSERRKES